MNSANRPGLYLVIHIDSFTHQIEGGYTMIDGNEVAGSAMNRARVIAYLALNPSVQISALYV